MAYLTLQEFNATTPDQLLVYTAQVFPGFIPLILFCFYLLVAIGTYIVQKGSTGRGHLSISCAVAGFATFIIALGLTTVEGLMNLVTLTIVFVVMIGGIIWLLLTKDSSI